MARISTTVEKDSKDGKKSGRGAVIFLFLFALPFAGAGTFVGYLGVSGIIAWSRAQSWVEVPARIISADLDVNHGDDSTTYRVRAEFQYDWDGRSYTSHRVAFGSGSDNIGSFHQDKYDELRRYAGTDRLFRCFLNPEQPGEAVLYRELRWGMLGFEAVFAAVFCLVGYGLMFAAIYGSRKVKEAEKLQAARPDEPWVWEEDWVDGRITANSRGKMIGAILFATLWNLISAPLIFILPGELAEGNWLILIGALFPLIGALLAFYAIYALLQWRKFGNTEFELFSNPGVLGGWIEGRVHTNIRGRDGGPFQLTLSCIRKETRGSGKNRTTTEKTLWQDTATVAPGALLAGPHGASVPVRFAIPFDAGPQSDKQASDPIEWRLSVAAELPGVDFSTQFDVPVFKTPDSDAGFAPEIEEQALAADSAIPTTLQQQGIVRRPTPAGGVQYIFRRARAKGAAIGLTIFTVIWCGFIALMRVLDAPIFFPIIFGLFALLMVAGLIDMWLKQTRVEVSEGRLALNRRFLGAGKTRFFNAGEVAAIKAEKGMQSGSKLFYQVVLHTRWDKKHTLASQIRDQRLAKRIARDLQEALGRGAGEPGFEPPLVEPAI
ncbi:MAG: DUF3592 domain-containing protein [Acidobacteriota bacterium]